MAFLSKIRAELGSSAWPPNRDRVMAAASSSATACSPIATGMQLSEHPSRLTGRTPARAPLPAAIATTATPTTSAHGTSRPTLFDPQVTAEIGQTSIQARILEPTRAIVPVGRFGWRRALAPSG
jgi:hypothetical protein